MIEKPKKERRFLKTLGKIGEILIQEVLIKIGSNLIKKIGGKKTLPSILFLLASLSLFAQYPATGNKQRLGYQTTGDGLVFRGRASDTTTIKSSGLNNAYFILDTVNNVLFNYIKTKGGWVFNNTDTVINNITVDTTSLSNRINLKLNISDTASMLAPYLRDADTTSLNLTSRFAAKLNLSDTASMLDKYLRLSGGTLTGALNGTSLNFSSGAVFNENANNSDFRVESVGRPNMLFVDAYNNRVGIGTNSPQAMLEVDGTLEIRDSATFYRGAKFLKSNPNTRFLIEGTNKTMFYGNLNEDKIGIGTTLPTKTLDVNGTLNATDSVTFGNTLSVTGNITENGLNVLTSSDTASMLTNYLRTGVAASTYLPLTGGTLSGSILNSWTSAYSSAPRNDGAVRRTYTQNLYSANGGNTDRVTHYYTFSQDECCASAPVTMYYGRFNGFYNQANIIYDASIYYHNNNQFYYRAFSEVENKVTFSIKPSTTVNAVTGTKADLYLSGDAQIDRSLNIGTTLGVTGVTTLSAPLTVNSSAVFNEGSTDSDFRVESDGNVNMVFVDASTDRVGIGTNTPTKTLDVNGELRIGTVSTTPTSLLGKDASNVVGEVTTVAQTGLMTRGETTATTGSPSATFTVTHGLGTNPSAIIVTSAGIGGAEKIIYEVYTKSSTTFSVQAWNLDGTEASSKSVKIYWLAIK